MPEKYTRTMLLNLMREGLHEIGYQDNLLKQEYGFVDVRTDDDLIRQVDLAAFAQEPPSYRNACFGIVVPPHNGPEAIMNYMALGAPQIFALHLDTQEVLRWKILAKGEPLLIEHIQPEQVRATIIARRDEWNPDKVLRAKSIGFVNEFTQLDFFDAGLIPVIEDLFYSKLDKVLRDAIVSSELVYKEHNKDKLDHRSLFRLIFRLVAAKLLGDRNHPGNWLSNNAQEVIEAVESFYSIPTDTLLSDRNVQDVAWKKIRTAFSFKNLSVEALAYIYENTLVSRETRKKYGTHATTHFIAEYALQKLPIEQISPDKRFIFEPFAGHAPFLIAGLERLRSLLPASISTEERHKYFVEMLAGMELDAFACEVARYSLILADYPNPNGWSIENDNFFTSSKLNSYLDKARIVLANPPYEDFEFDGIQKGSSVYSTNQAVEALSRVLHHQPEMFGFILPRSFIDGRMYLNARKQITDLYDNVSLVALPDNTFNFSEAETVFLIAHGRRTYQPQWTSALVKKTDYEQFTYTGEPTWQIKASDSFIESQIYSSNPIFWYTPMQPVWDALVTLPLMGNFVDIHRGVEYNVPFQGNRQKLVSDTPRLGFIPGLISVTDELEPYTTDAFSYINIDSDKMRRNTHLLPWGDPKIITNGNRLSRGTWTIAATIDQGGLICLQNFYGVWSKGNLPLEIIAALLNSPIANAFLSTHNTSRRNKLETIKQIPIPNFRPSQIHLIVSLVRDYISHREQWRIDPHRAGYFERLCRGIIKQIDAEILSAYDLPPDAERELIRYFDGYKRPGPVALTHLQPSPMRKLYTSLIKVENIREENSKKVIEAVVMNWNPYQIVQIPASVVPHDLADKLDRDTWLLAHVNVGAGRAEDLIFENIELAPEPDPNDGLS